MVRFKGISRASIAVLMILASPCLAYPQVLVKSAPVPELMFYDENGGTHSLSELRGQVVLLNIWATWCNPCRKEMPSLYRLQDRLRKRNFRVIAVSADKDNGADLVRSFYKNTHISNLDVLIANQGSIARLGIHAFPTSMIIDTDGTELMVTRGYVDWDDLRVRRFIIKLLDKNGQALSKSGENVPL